jgi:hypothetical protein
MMSVPPLKIDPKYGYFPWWPEDGDAWIHPEDVAVARAMIPSGRVFRRDGMIASYALFRYGDSVIRVRPRLWQEVSSEGYEIGDWVEVLARGMLNAARIGRIREMVWDERTQAMQYQISENGLPIERLYSRDDLRPTEPIE